MRIRIKFRKFGRMKFIGHLDMMRFFQKAFRRAGIDICYTEGFSPHQILSFAAPLGVGITSDGEYLDIEVHTTKSSRQSIQDLNAVMPEGVEITGYVQLEDTARNAMAAVAAADYEIWYKQGSDIPQIIRDYPKLQQCLNDFFIKPSEVLITKKTKKSEKKMDLKKLVYDFRILPPKERFFGLPAFYINVCTGSTDNLKPELVLESFFASMGQDYPLYDLQIHRKDVCYASDDGSFKPLLFAGQEITQNIY